MTPAALVNAFIAAVVAKDLDTACAMVTADCEYDNVPMGKVFGPDGIKSALGGFLGACSEVEWVVHREGDSGNVVFNERLDRFKMGERWVEIPVAGVFEVSDGKISLWRDYFDRATFTAQLPA